MIRLLPLLLLLTSCGSTVYMSPQGAIAVNMGTLSKLGYTELHAKTPQGGSLDIRQDSFNGTEIVNTGLIGWAASKAANAATANLRSNNSTTLGVQQSKDKTTLGLAKLKVPPPTPTILVSGQTAVFAPK